MGFKSAGVRPAVKPTSTALPKRTQVHPPSIPVDDFGDPDHDPVTYYARLVLAGRILANRWVKLACKRHISDLSRTDIYFDLDACHRHLEYFPQILRLRFKETPHLRPFDLHLWQKFVQGSIFGWRRVNPDGSLGYRRFQIVYVEGAKGCGKTPLVAGTMLYLTTADGEPDAECYAAAGDKDQAMVLFREAVKMRDNSPELECRLICTGKMPNVSQLTFANAQSDKEYHLLGSYFCPIASDQTQSGPRPHGVAFDELHEIKRETVVDMMREAIGKNRTQPLCYEITNSGVGTESVCYLHRREAEQMLEGTMPDDHLFAFILGLDTPDGEGEDKTPGDIPEGVNSIQYLLDHRELWVKANPGINEGLPAYEYVEQHLRRALATPSKKNLTLRLHFCLWTDAVSVWIPDEQWMACSKPILATKIEHQKYGMISNLEAQLLGKRCYGGIDLARTNDWSALILLFPDDEAGGDPNNQVYSILEYFWIDEGTYKKRRDKSQIIEQWRDEGDIFVTEGEVFDPTPIRDFLLNTLAHRYLIQAIGYDRTFVHQLVTSLTNDGFTMIDFAQTHYRMGAPVAEIARRVTAKLFRHRAHKAMRWMMRNVMLRTDVNLNGMIDKQRSVEKVDGPVALANAVGICMTINKGAEGGGSKHYEERDVIVLDWG